MSTATKSHSFCVVRRDNALIFVSAEAGDTTTEVVVATPEGDLAEATMPVQWSRDLYSAARSDGRLLSTDHGQLIIDGEASLVRLTQRGRSFYRAVKGSPFRYAQACAKRAGVKTGYDVVS